MVDTASIDTFLTSSLRAIRSGQAAVWPESEAGDWQSREALTEIWARIEYHGIVMLLHPAREHLQNWPEKMTSRIAEEARLVGLWEVTHAAALSRLVDALAQADIEAVLMKGTALAYSVYEEPAARRRGDSDLLVRPSDLERVREVFEECGWHRDAQTHGVNYQEGWLYVSAAHFEHSVDLHWEPSDRAVLQKVLKPDDFFDHKRPLPRLAQKAWRADPALTLIHETINQKWHEAHGYWTEHGNIRGARRLIWSLDFDLLAGVMEEADWRRLYALCQERGIGPLVAGALRAASSDLGTNLSEAHVVQLERLELRAEIAAFLGATDNLTEFWLNLRSAPDWGERARMIHKRGFPPRDYLVSKYPGQSAWPTLLLQGRLLTETALRIARKVIVR
ncbi:nucleotidyltransferase family protein [uncultured Erythrobacter sp.]|uniref:nucleotidyltransferase family protein n=1 Tax=uncultured Erythrobacter sp. TaxID=263913 RepID=UPI00262EB39B|nr:nucleotidyltransferase family protein [uncultured Erythrobacter sp.]